MNKPQGYINYEVYEDAVNYVGLATVTPPDIAQLTHSVSGAGLGGNVDAVMLGMVEAMECTITFHSVMDAAVKLMQPVKHQLDFRIAEQIWETDSAAHQINADKLIMLVLPKTTSMGEVAPASAASVSGTYAVYRYEGYLNDVEQWVVDPMNCIFRVKGKDYWDDIRKALGK